MKKLQVMICTFGREGIGRVADSVHPQMADVEYIVGWQLPDGDYPVPEKLKERSDFKIYRTNSRGLSKNRNFILSKATSPLLLISDDDVDYSESGLTTVIESFENNLDMDIITFRYDSKEIPKEYPDFSFPLWSPPKSYYPSSIEISFRRESVQGRILFNELFGIGATFPSGEEDIFMHDCRKSGLKGLFIPAVICSHDGATTSDRDSANLEFIRTKGAVFSELFPFSWPLRLVTHLIRNNKKGGGINSSAYARAWLKGVSDYRKLL